MTQAANLAALGTNAGTTGILPAAGGGTAGTAGVTGFKNRIINGGMVIDQRNSGSAITGITSGAYYAVDRFVFYNQNSATYSIQQVSDAPSNFVKSFKVTATTAGSTGTAGWTSFLNQKIEGYNIADLGNGTSAAQTITVSFWVKSSVTGTFPLIFDNDVDRYYATTYTISSANTWEQKTIVVPGCTTGTWNTTNGRGLGLYWGLGSGSTYTTSTLNAWTSQANPAYYFTSGATALGATLNATWQLTGVQLEVGSAATNFDVRSYTTELQLCQRYYQRSYDIGTATGTSFNSNYEIPAYFIGTGNYGFVCSKTFPTAMRGTPTITVYSATGTAGSVTPWNGSSSGTIASVNANQNGITAGNFNNNTSAGVVYGFGYTASAEL